MGINIHSVRGDSHQPSRAWNPRPVICIYLYFPHPFPLLDYLNHFEKIITSSPAPPIFLSVGSRPGPLEAWAGVEEVGGTMLNPICCSPGIVVSTARSGLKENLPS